VKSNPLFALIYVAAGAVLAFTAEHCRWYVSLGAALFVAVCVAAAELAAYQQHEEAEDDTHHEALDILSEAQHDAEDLADTALRIRQKAEKWDACEREKIRAAVNAVMDEEAAEAAPESGVRARKQDGNHRGLSDKDIEEIMASCDAEDDCGTTVFARPQPAPVNASGEPLWPCVIGRILGDAAIDSPAADHLRHIAALVAKDMADRDAEGRKKYGVPIVVDNGRDHGVDAYQEALDGVVYFEGEIERQRAAGKVATAQRWQRIQDLQLQVVMMTREELDRR